MDKTPVQSFKLSIVAPMYNEEEVCELFFKTVVPIVKSITSSYEIICVNDGSEDNTLSLLRSANRLNGRIKIVDLSRNFGKELALTCGIDHAEGDAVIPIDCDLQDPPELIPKMVDKWLEGFDVVLAIRTDRTSDSKFKQLTASAFYKIMHRVGEVPIPRNAGDFRLMDRRVIKALKRLPERTRFMKGMFAWLGFRQTVVTYTRPSRAAGKTKFRFWTLWNFALEGIFSFTTLPLRIWSYVGLLLAFASSVYLFFILARTILYGADVPGYPSLISLILFFNGMIMVELGVLGEYLGRVFIEVKNRPLYLVRETIGISEDAENLESRKVASQPGRLN